MLEKPSEAEEMYFKRIELENRKSIRARVDEAAARLSERRDIAAASGTADLHIAEQIQALGFDAEAAHAFDLLPLIAVAWADGSVSREERATVLRALASRGVEPSTSTFQFFEAMLEEPPSDAWLREAYDVLRSLLGGRDAQSRDVIDLCADVAAASGGFLGLGDKVSASERNMIREIASSLGDGAVAEFKKRLG